MTKIALDNDWLTVAETLRYGKFSRSRLYRLFEERAVKTFVLKGRGNVKGIRYVSKTSLDEYFEHLCATQSRD